MPLTKLQVGILRLLAAHRDPESYVAGSTPLNRGAGRSSDDIDIFHDREEREALPSGNAGDGWGDCGIGRLRQNG